MRWLKQFGEHQHSNKAVVAAVTIDADEEALLRYPPFVKGFPVTSVERLLVYQAELLDNLRGSLGYSLSDFKAWVLPVVQRYAAFVHHLPASESHHHRGAGGLLHHGLEVACWALQGSEAVIFPLPEILSQRRRVEQLWRLATCFAGLLHDAGKPLSDLCVTDREGQLTWNPYLESLLSWAQRQQLSRYFIRWREQRYQRHVQFSLLALPQLLPSESLQVLAVDGPELLQALLQAVSGVGSESLLGKLVAKADQESVARDLKQSRLAGDAAAYGVPVERYLFDAMRRLLAAGTWQVNQLNAKIWHLEQGLFIAWQQGAAEVLVLLTQDGVAGIPRDIDTLADILLERGLARPYIQQRAGEQPITFRYWPVTVPIIKAEVTMQKNLLLLQLDHPALLLTASPPAPLTGALVGESTVSAANEFQERVVESALATGSVVEALEEPVADPEPSLIAIMPVSISSPFDSLSELINGAGEAAEALRTALTPLLQGEGLGASIRLLGSKVFIPYPVGAAQLGDPTEVMNNLWAAGVIVPDAILPGRKVLTVGEQKALLLAPQWSAAILAAYRALPVKSGEVSSPNNTGGVQTVKPLLVGKPFATAISPSTSTTPEVGCDQTTTTVIQQLKQQIQQGQGRWLASPVQKLAGEWVTSDHALDRLITDYPAQFDKKTLIYHINLNRKKPLLRWQAGQLYLKAEGAYV